MPRRKSLLLTILIVVWIFVIMAAVPRILNYQGKLTDSRGLGVNDTFDITFRIFISDTATTPLWQETIPEVVIQKGMFSVQLGEVSSFPDSLDFSRQYWVEVAVEDEVMSPRKKLSSSAYSIRACLLYTSPSPRDLSTSRMPSSA